MPWSAARVPPAMRHLPDDVRTEAIAIANALLAQGRDEGAAIRIAIAQACRRPGRAAPDDAGDASDASDAGDAPADDATSAPVTGFEERGREPDIDWKVDARDVDKPEGPT